jgi:hypothetical protein
MRALLVAAALLTACKGQQDDYVRKSRGTEAALHLNLLAKRVKAYYIETSALPKGQTALTPPTPCCQSTDGRCPMLPREEWEADPIWKLLDFGIDELSRFQYRYAASADGTSFTVTAVGDPMCEGAPVTFTLTGRVVNGVITTTTENPYDRKAP